MSVGRICSRVVATATGNETIKKAAQRMADHDVGTLVVVEASHPQRPVGSSWTGISPCGALRRD